MYKLLSHNDLDGVGCGILAKLAFGQDVYARYNSVSGLDREVKNFLDNGDKETFLFITDLSVNQENEKHLEAFYKAGGKVQLIDHHKTALHFNKYEWGHIVVEEPVGKMASATSLFYEYLVSNELLTPTTAITEFVELVRQYDTWEWEKNNNQSAKRLNALFYLITIETFEAKMLQRLATSDHFYFDDFENQLLTMEDEKIDRYIRRKKRELVQVEVNEQYAGVVYAESYHSELGNELGKDYPHLDYIVILNIGGRRVGFRTIHDDVDVSAVAGIYGGGGHAKASGCLMTDAAYQAYAAVLFSLTPLREDAKGNRYNVKSNVSGSLYESRTGERFYIYQATETHWQIEINDMKVAQEFSSFEEAESYLKRNDQAWLVRDDIFVNYLLEKVKKDK